MTILSNKLKGESLISSTGPLSILSLLCALFFVHTASYWILVDDAFISFRYAENLSRGLGLVFNEGERVEGYTNFLWVMILAGYDRLGMNVPLTSQVLGVFFSLLTLVVTYFAGRRVLGLNKWQALVPCAVLASSASVAMWSGSGMETTMYMALFTAALTMGLVELEKSPALPAAGVLFGIATLTRPEGAGVFAVFLFIAFAIRFGRLGTLVRMAAGFALVFLPHMAFRLFYYGDPLPNTFYAKVPFRTDFLGVGFQYLLRFLECNFLLSVLFVAAYIFLSSRQQRKKALIASACILFIWAYVVSLGGDFYPYFRYLIPYLPWFILLSCSGALLAGESIGRRVVKMKGALPSVLLLTVAALMMFHGKLYSDAVFRTSIKRIEHAEEGLRLMGVWLKNNMPGDKTMALSNLGRLSYYSELRAIDMLGIVDKEIARGKPKPNVIVPGHFKFDADYVLSRKPDIVVLEVATKNLNFRPGSDLNIEVFTRKALANRYIWHLELANKKEFRLNYALRVAPVSKERVFFYFERDSSLLSLRKRLENEEASYESLIELAMLYRNRGLMDEASASIKDALVHNPDEISTLLSLALFHFEHQKHEEASAVYEKILGLNPGNAEAKYGLAVNLQIMGKGKEAAVLLREYLAADSKNDYYSSIAQKLLAEIENSPEQ